MITTQQLYEWRSAIQNTKNRASDLAEKNVGRESTHLYYTHIAETADAQFSLVQRLVRQSEQNDMDGQK